MTTLDPVFEKAGTERLRLYLGTGCGKTTATFGLTLRALSKGLNVTLVFFDKLEENSSEGKGLRMLSENQAEGFGKLVMNYTGVNRVGTGPKGSFRLYSSPNGILPEDKDAAKQGLTYLVEGLMRKDDIVIGDELLDVARVGLVDFDYVKQILNLRQDPTVLVLTGRRAPDWLMNEASTISTTTQIRHHGRAIEGIDC
ncbi:MAG: cob(I)yrinic acid a,c-diamide adenosyltransferase [Candidatus Melainabacteria bacterium]|jgi:cob(I)alamin adenosyltransferase|uniref:Cob(I)yrinic acid a,c-diamide adenosyltransferase n=1 Tax=Candidatus Obscuribacter phosphatis TaxID=1906157 RepID=A0A8J7TL97_9BACT|nr:cob(I)yrinic acid a,c-diamide adenosyltransferase [Candidatus Obscuribacter phosphatis]MCA0312377.1 cob(I)yrinic acid a,c-diamide adenosyltransferase [Candidatus Melainabacteria bacterium]OPZ87712.1 MAG: cob(I)alamin adenolsyltransferase/cobinamide ATP-dependent adenolsyltransferase [bacterium ADurb.Bin425]